ncbi:MAG TPA: hypothetical protein VFT42_07415 [Solirubrobacteraceae bacterium]|nr:hypothetical protein [Solirubrobacteraceae bacterium]
MKVAGFLAALAALFGIGALAGGLLDPSAPGGETAAAGTGHGGGMATMRPMPVRGLAVAENGLRLVVATPELRRGRTGELRFRVLDARDRAVRAFDLEHTKRMHVIVVRRDLVGFQHLHPTMAADGTWSVPLRVADAGSYRLLADFSHDGTPVTLGSDLRVDGAADLVPLPAPAPTAVSDGYAVRLDAPPGRAGEEGALRFTVTRDGRPVATEPYLGAGGHLVALRAGDLAFLHVHPVEARGDTIAFEATFPTAGAYRLFLQFRADGRVHTVAFTQEVR